MPMTMISPMNDAMLKVVRVISRARNTPDVERIADDKNGHRRRQCSKLEQQHDEYQQYRQQQHQHQVVERLLLFLVSAAINHSNRRRQMEAIHHFLYCRDGAAEVPAFQPRRNRHIALQVLAADFGLPRAAP